MSYMKSVRHIKSAVGRSHQKCRRSHQECRRGTSKVPSVTSRVPSVTSKSAVGLITNSVGHNTNKVRRSHQKCRRSKSETKTLAKTAKISAPAPPLLPHWSYSSAPSIVPAAPYIRNASKLLGTPDGSDQRGSQCAEQHRLPLS